MESGFRGHASFRTDVQRFLQHPSLFSAEQLRVFLGDENIKLLAIEYDIVKESNNGKTLFAKTCINRIINFLILLETPTIIAARLILGLLLREGVKTPAMLPVPSQTPALLPVPSQTHGLLSASSQTPVLPGAGSQMPASIKAIELSLATETEVLLDESPAAKNRRLGI